MWWGDALSRIEAALSAGCEMGLVCNDRAAAELALSAAQRMKVTPSPRIARACAARRLPVLTTGRTRVGWWRWVRSKMLN